jgi:alcohol dehydrogenase (NADP+)
MGMAKIADEVRFDRTVASVDPATVRTVRLSSGKMMPVAAFGTFHSDWAQAYMKDATVEAIRLGWRHIDTARAYENEEVVGEAIREALRRGYITSKDELYITAKLWNGHMSRNDVEPALNNTLRALGVEKVGMYLNHWPWPNVHTPGADGHYRNPHAVPYILGDFMETWGEIVRLKKAGKIVDVGTSNHTEACMKLLLRDTDAASRPVVNQMEMHPLFQQTGLRGFLQSQGIVCTDYMALGSPNRPARVSLSWAVQRENTSGGFVAMSTRSAWIADNLKAATADVLTPAQMLRISGDDSPGNPGIDVNNRLIWGQVFLWPEALGDWRVLWNDTQVFETREGYKKFKSSFHAHYSSWQETAVGLPADPGDFSS